MVIWFQTFSYTEVRCRLLPSALSPDLSYRLQIGLDESLKKVAIKE